MDAAPLSSILPKEGQLQSGSLMSYRNNGQNAFHLKMEGLLYLSLLNLLLNNTGINVISSLLFDSTSYIL